MADPSSPGSLPAYGSLPGAGRSGGFSADDGPGSLGVPSYPDPPPAATTGGSLRANSPYAVTPAPRTPGGSIPHESEHGAFLGTRLEYVVPPTLSAVERDCPGTPYTLFMGHMRFETTSGEVRWIIRRMCGITPVKAEPRTKGCFLVHLATEADATAVRVLHRRILIDHHGMWVAKDEGEARVLSDYVEQVLSKGPKRRLRLPRDCVTVETPHVNERVPPQPEHSPTIAHPPGMPSYPPQHGMPPHNGGFGGPQGFSNHSNAHHHHHHQAHHHHHHPHHHQPPHHHQHTVPAHMVPPPPPGYAHQGPSPPQNGGPPPPPAYGTHGPPPQGPGFAGGYNRSP